MFRLGLLPWEYGVRNLFRRPTRSLLTLGALTTVVLLVFVVVGFIRGLEKSLANSGNSSVIFVYSLGAEQNIENSSIPSHLPGILSASLEGIQRRFGIRHLSPELYLGTRVTVGGAEKGSMGLVRGVTRRAPLVRKKVRLVEGNWPGPGEVIVGRLVPAKLGCSRESLAVGNTIEYEGEEWTVSGRFVSGGSALESEIWCPLEDFQQALKRQDISLVALSLAPGASPANVDLFCKERNDLNVQAVVETDYYASLQKHYRPVRLLAWTIVVLIAGSGVFAGLNTMYGAVAGRIREVATLQAIGFRRRSILISLIQEATLLSAAGSLLAGLIALALLNGMGIRFTMGAFQLEIDSISLLIGCGTGILLGVLGALPPAFRALRLPVAESLKAV